MGHVERYFFYRNIKMEYENKIFRRIKYFVANKILETKRNWNCNREKIKFYVTGIKIFLNIL